MPDIFQRPRYGKALAKYMRISPRHMPLLLDELETGFATEEQRRELMLFDLAAQKKRYGRSLGLAREGLALQKHQFRRGKKQTRLANLIGAAGVGLSGLSGYAQLKQANLINRMLAEQAARYN